MEAGIGEFWQVPLFPEAASPCTSTESWRSLGRRHCLPSLKALSIQWSVSGREGDTVKTAKGKKEAGRTNTRMDILKLQCMLKTPRGLINAQISRPQSLPYVRPGSRPRICPRRWLCCRTRSTRSEALPEREQMFLMCKKEGAELKMQGQQQQHYSDSSPVLTLKDLFIPKNCMISLWFNLVNSQRMVNLEQSRYMGLKMAQNL